MNMGTPSDHILKALLGKKPSKQVWYMLFDYFREGLVPDMARSITLPNLGTLRIRDLKNSQHVLNNDYRSEDYPNGVFFEEGYRFVQDNPIGYVTVWGVTTKKEWEIWEVTLKYEAITEGFDAIFAKRILKTVSFDELIGHPYMEGMKGSYFGIWDALNIELERILKKREDGLANARAAAEKCAFIYQMLRSQYLR